MIAARSSWLQSFAAGTQPDATTAREAPRADFAIVDRTGRSLAKSVECFDVTVSPRAMWRSHTPDRMASKIAAILAQDSPSLPGLDVEPWDDRRVLERSMPDAFRAGMLPGRCAPEAPTMLWFEEADLERVRAWLATGAIGDRAETSAIRGLTLVARPRPRQLDGGVDRGGAGAGPGVWTIAIEPVVALSRDTRAAQLPTRTLTGGEVRVAPPERWTRRILDDLITLIGRERLVRRLDPDAAEAFAHTGPIEQSELLRDALWAELMPTRFRVLARGVDPVRAHALRDLMEDEAVSPWQLQLVARTERRHPTRPGGLPVAPDPQAELDRDGDAFALLGHWGVLDEERATARATRDREERPHVLPWDKAEDPFEAYRRSLVVEQRPWSGIELLCQSELENGPWAPLIEGTHGREYVSRVRHVARDRRRAWEDGVPNYFVSAGDATEMPRIEVTLDAHLQEALHAELGRLMDRHRPALAMGIAVDVETGDVLALGSRSAYAYSGFAPVLHVFTPGSTFKAIIMALALDAGVTYPEESFPTYAGRGLSVGSRSIREAEGAPTEAEISASTALAQSCNAVLVQIALRMDARDLRERILRLGYAAVPGAGLGPERAGSIPKLKNGTWRRPYEHASVGFGHEIGTTLWQHASALATLLRGGVARPLRLVRSIERGGTVWDRELDPGQRVIGEAACRNVRAMMAIGAEEGTGRHVANRELNPEFDYLGTKTGTTEKVSTELCVHLELEALARASAKGTGWTSKDRAALFALPKPHRRGTCYTSSMCAVGRVERDGKSREIMVLIVADDPTGAERFGSRVTGPSAIAALRRALGLEPPAVEGAVQEVSAGQRSTGSPDATGRASARALDASWLADDLPWAAEPASVRFEADERGQDR